MSSAAKNWDCRPWRRPCDKERWTRIRCWNVRAIRLMPKRATNLTGVVVRSRLGEITPSGVDGLVLGCYPYGVYGPQLPPNIRGTGAGVIGDGSGNLPRYPNRRRNRGIYPNIYGYPNI